MKIRWPDGTISTASSWSQLLRELRRNQWRALSPMEFRRELSARVKAWTGVNVSTAGSAEQFLRRLAATGAFEIEE